MENANEANGSAATTAELDTHDQDAGAERVMQELKELIGPNSLQTQALQSQIAEFMTQAATRADTAYEAARDALMYLPQDRYETALETVRDMISSLAADLHRSADIARTSPKLLGNFPPIYDGRVWEGSDITPQARKTHQAANANAEVAQEPASEFDPEIVGDEPLGLTSATE